MLLFAVFVRYNKTPIGFIFAQYGKILSFDFNIGLDLRSRPILKSQLNIVSCKSKLVIENTALITKTFFCLLSKR